MKEQICEGVYRVEIPIPYDFKRVNCYLIEGEKGFTVIDTGDYNDEAIHAWEEVIGEGSVERVLITHAHADHFGLAPWFQKQYGATIVMSTATNEQFLLRKSFFIGDHFESTMFSFLADYGFGDESDGEVFNVIEAYDFLPDELFEAGDFVRVGDDFAQSIATPGHAIDHVCFYVKEKGCLFIGDHLLGEMSTIVMPHEGMENPLALYIPSFTQLMDLRVNYTLPGHGIMIDNLQARIQQILTRYEKRWQQIIEEMARGEKNAVELTAALYAKANVHYMNSALLQTITNLNYLASEGKVEKFKKDGIWTFQAS